MSIKLYRALLGQEVSQFFEPSMGLLLDPGLHKSFDDLEWAFYPHVSFPTPLLRDRARCDRYVPDSVLQI